MKRWMIEQRSAFETFIKDLREFAVALAKDPIVDISGVVQEKTQEVPASEVANRIANELRGLEKHTARVRIQTNKLEEHTIETEKPKSGISESQLRERKERI